MNTKQIEMVLALSETLNFNKAAEACFISQPTLSYQIQMIEEELRFKIFDRTQKSVNITPAGKSFVESLRKISNDYRVAVEQAQNYSDKFTNDITISLPYRSCIHLLPKAMVEMEKINPQTLITPHYGIYNRLDDFLSGKVDILFDDYEVIKNLKGIKIIHFYQSRVYLVCNKNDILAKKSIIRCEDLMGRTLMVGGGSQRVLKKAQDLVLNSIHIPFFNSNDHDTTLTNIEANKAIVLSPGFLHDRNDGFAWIPFDFHETIDCCLVIKENDNRKSIKDFIEILLNLYSKEDMLSL